MVPEVLLQSWSRGCHWHPQKVLAVGELLDAVVRRDGFGNWPWPWHSHGYCHLGNGRFSCPRPMLEAQCTVYHSQAVKECGKVRSAILHFHLIQDKDGPQSFGSWESKRRVISPCDHRFPLPDCHSPSPAVVFEVDIFLHKELHR